MKRIASRSKRVSIGILTFLFIMEEVSLFAAAITTRFEEFPPNEIGASLLLTVFYATLGFANLLAFSVTYFYFRKLIKQERHCAVLGALVTAVVAPLSILFAP